jgi:hypothetical protein
MATFSKEKIVYEYLQRSVGLVHFGRFFSQTHLVTLPIIYVDPENMFLTLIFSGHVQNAEFLMEQ